MVTAVNSIAPWSFLPISGPAAAREPSTHHHSPWCSAPPLLSLLKGPSGSSLPPLPRYLSRAPRSERPRSRWGARKADARNWAVCGSVSEDLDVIPARSSESEGQQEVPVVAGEWEDGEDLDRLLVDRAINASIVLAVGTFAITRLLTIDRDYWHGWTIYEILRYAPQHNWTAYEEALKRNPVLAKMMISGVVYSIGDWIAQCYEGKPLFEFDRSRMFRSGLVGFTLHGSLSHYYYQFCEALFPFQGWWVVPAKVVFDQTAWASIWNSIYYVVLGFLRFESPANIFSELKATYWPMLTAGWKLWPFAHLITYGVIPVEQRLLWVDCVELIWVTILSTYSNEKSEARNSEAPGLASYSNEKSEARNSEAAETNTKFH